MGSGAPHLLYKSYQGYIYLGGSKATSLPPTHRRNLLETLLPQSKKHKLSSDELDMALVLLTGQPPGLNLQRVGFTNSRMCFQLLRNEMDARSAPETLHIKDLEVLPLIRARRGGSLQENALARGFRPLYAPHDSGARDGFDCSVVAMQRLGADLGMVVPPKPDAESVCDPRKPSADSVDGCCEIGDWSRERCANGSCGTCQWCLRQGGQGDDCERLS